MFHISKAHDKVWHHGLIHKLPSVGVSENMTELIRSFLFKKTFQVKFGQRLLKPKRLTSGVPKGEVFFPALKNTFTADIPVDEASIPYVTQQ